MENHHLLWVNQCKSSIHGPCFILKSEITGGCVQRTHTLRLVFHAPAGEAGSTWPHGHMAVDLADVVQKLEEKKGGCMLNHRSVLFYHLVMTNIAMENHNL